MMKCLLQGIMENLKTWIEIERNSEYRNSYIEYYGIVKEKTDKL